MKTLRFIFRSFQTRVTFILILTMIFSGVISNLLIYKFTLDSQFSQLRDKLMVIAQTAALTIDPDTLSRIPLDRDGVRAPEYQTVADKLYKIKELNPLVAYIYIMTRTAQDGIWQFIVDPVNPTREQRRKGLTSYPGDRYNASRFPDMLKAFDGASADRRLVRDEWGVTLSGYAPIRDQGGKAIAVLGVDMMANDVYAMRQEVHRRAILVLLLGVVLSLVIGMLIARGITDPIERLVDGTRHIAQGDLRYKVRIEGADEINQLAQAFNKMALRLYRSRKKLDNYFYHTVEALIRILEARDRYTRGHSERVSEYAEKIAAKMGFNPQEVIRLKEAALIHDIGKLGVQESILNKKDALSDEEWESIRHHPVIAEDILRPLLLNKEMLAMIRGHHERYDGSGYPDKHAGDAISIFTQILSVADAYDAMTSPRAYRQALRREEAIRELQKNRGSQFSPKVVDTFLAILEEG
jgi:putative nucleotidyltransferase with HDIG domain